MLTMTHHNLKDTFFMQRALKLARRARELGEVPVGAVAVLGDEIVSEGSNCPIKTNDFTSHAEIIALRKASEKLNNYRLPGVTLYVTLEPCIMCIGAMIQARIKRLVFGAKDPKSGAITSVFQVLDENKLNHKIEYQGGIMAEECGAILSDFFRSKR